MNTKLTIALIAIASLTACGKKVENPPEVYEKYTRSVVVEDMITGNGTRCVVATTNTGGPAISCEWK